MTTEERFRAWHLKIKKTDAGCVLIHAPTGVQLKLLWSPDVVDDLEHFHGLDTANNLERFILGELWKEVRRLEPELELIGVGMDD